MASVVVRERTPTGIHMHAVNIFSNLFNRVSSAAMVRAMPSIPVSRMAAMSPTMMFASMMMLGAF